MQHKYEQIADRIAAFICDQVRKAGAQGAVFGLSGGIDSAVTASLCVRALGKEKCTALIMPHEKITPQSETADGMALAAQLGIEHHTCNIEPIVSSFQQASSISGGKVPTGNLLARVRASMLYYYANTLDCLVVGTDDKSEYLIGYFTKYGDGASDILPIRDLYKTQVQELGRFLGVPDNIADKQPGAHLWKDHDARNELGLEYDQIDKMLHDWLGGAGKEEIAARHGIKQDAVSRIMNLHAGSHHKRQLPPFWSYVGESRPAVMEVGARMASGSKGVLEALAKADCSMMHKTYDSWPDMAQDGYESHLDEVDYSGDHVMFAGMGGSGSVADMLCSLLSCTSTHASTVKGYVLPQNAGPDSLVVATSISGDTLETVSLLKNAHEAGCQCIAFSDGGKIEGYCKRTGIEYRRVRRTHSSRASFASYAFSALGVLEPLLPVDRADIAEALRQMRTVRNNIRSSNSADNAAIDLAQWLPKSPVIYYPHELQPAAVRFKNSLHENAKMRAAADDVIEACHNSIVPWHDHLAAGPVMIKGDGDHLDTQKRWKILGEYFASRGIDYREVCAVSGGIISKIICLIYLLDYASIYKAAILGTDPTPIEPIDYVKERC